MGRKRIMRASALAAVLLAGVCAFAACGGIPPADSAEDPDQGGGGETPSETISAGQAGYYTLEQKTVESFDVTGEYLFNCILLDGEGGAVWYETDYTGRSERTGTYETEGDTVVVVIGVREYAFEFSAQHASMTFSGKIDRQDVVMRYIYDEDYVLPSSAAGGVAFTDELFGEDKNENFYNYCPTVMMEGNDTMHVWYCSNETSGNVTDFVAYRKGTLNTAGKWEFTQKQLVLQHGAQGEWDSRHVCDPSVVKGSFAMGGETYSYMMAYLGCVTSNNCCNEVGIAVAKAPEGPWVKVESLNPIANFYESDVFAADRWGFGQPCLLSVDGAGKVLLFYAMGAVKTCTIVEEWDFSDLDAPQKLREAEIKERGSVNASGQSDCINNADFAYDPVLGRLYCLKEDFPYPTDGGVNWIAGSNTLMYIETDASFDLLFGEEPYTWNVCGALNEGTGHARNHNAGIVTDAFGTITDPYRIPVLYTAADLASDYPDWNAGGQWPSLHTYRLHGLVFEVR